MSDMMYVNGKLAYKFTSPSTEQETSVYVNLLSDEREMFLGEHTKLYGFTNTHSVYVWDASKATHEEVVSYIDSKPKSFLSDLKMFDFHYNVVKPHDNRDENYFNNHYMVKRIIAEVE